jgi:hypothetical protein
MLAHRAGGNGWYPCTNRFHSTADAWISIANQLDPWQPDTSIIVLMMRYWKPDTNHALHTVMRYAAVRESEWDRQMKRRGCEGG